MKNNLQDDIIDIVSSIDDVEELSKIYNYIHLTAIRSYIQTFLDSKGFGQKDNVDWLSELICFKSLTTVQEKLHFCSALLFNNNLIQEDTFLTMGQKYLLDDTRLRDMKVFHDIKPHIMNKTHLYGFSNTAVGRGEIFFTLFGKNVSKGWKGDIEVMGREVEIKATKARCCGMHGYNSMASSNPIEIFKTIGVELETRSMSFIKWKSFNKELEKVCPEQVYDAFRTLFSITYFHAVINEHLDKWLPRILQDGLLHEDSLHYLTALQIDYYKSMEEFNHILFIEPQTYCGVAISNGEEYLNYKDHFKVNQFAWTGKDNRSCVNSLTYLG